MNTEKTSIENESQPSCLGAVIRRFYAVFSDHGNDLTQKSIWFDDPQKAIDYKNDKMNTKGKYIILEKSGKNGL
jgi:hypothetical protein